MKTIKKSVITITILTTIVVGSYIFGGAGPLVAQKQVTIPTSPTKSTAPASPDASAAAAVTALPMKIKVSTLNWQASFGQQPKPGVTERTISVLRSIQLSPNAGATFRDKLIGNGNGTLSFELYHVGTGDGSTWGIDLTRKVEKIADINPTYGIALVTEADKKALQATPK